MNRNIPIQIYERLKPLEALSAAAKSPVASEPPDINTQVGFLLTLILSSPTTPSKNTTISGSTTLALVQSLRKGNISSRYVQDPKEAGGNHSIWTSTHLLSSTSPETILRQPQLDFTIPQKQEHRQDAIQGTQHHERNPQRQWLTWTRSLTLLLKVLLTPPVPACAPMMSCSWSIASITIRVAKSR